MKIARLLLLSLLFIATSAKTEGPNNIAFQYLTSENGLSQNYVDCLLKDSKGFVWAGTHSGLNRFDGYAFRKFLYTPFSNNASSGTFVYNLCEDYHGNIWMATSIGLHMYSYNADSVKYCPITPTPEPIRDVIRSSDSTIWVAGNLWVRQYQVSKNGDWEEKQVLSLAEFDKSTESLETRCLLKNDAYLWIGTNKGVIKHDLKLGTSKLYTADVNNPNTLPTNQINCLYQSPTQGLMIGTTNGLAIYQPQSDNFKVTQMPNNVPGILPHNWINSITTDPLGNTIFGTLGGISIFTPSTGLSQIISSVEYSNYGLNSDFVNCLLSDAEGNIWIGTEGGGINRFNVYVNHFVLYLHEPANNNSLSGRIVNSAFDDGENLWIGLLGGGLDKLNKQSGKFTHYQSVFEKPNTIPNNFVSALTGFKDELWMATWGEGMALLDKAGQRTANFKRFKYVPGTETGLYDNFISSLVADKWGDIWVGTSKGINVVNRKTLKIDRVSFTHQGHTITPIGYLLFDRYGNLWIGTPNGLFKVIADNQGRIDRTNPTIYKCENQPDVPSSLSGSYVISMTEDSKGNIWIGTYGQGINILSPNNNEHNRFEFKRLAERDGLCNGIVFGLVEDRNGLIWVATDNGLSSYDTQNAKFKNYTVGDGLPTNRFFWNSAYKAPNGDVYFGSTNGLVSPRFQLLKEVGFTAAPVFTMLSFGNDTIRSHKKYFGINTLLPASISVVNELTIPHQAKNFSLVFSALHYSNPERVLYEYKLDGFDNDWNVTSHLVRRLSYMNLPQGEYTLRLRAKNPLNHQLVSPERTIRITVMAPFYKTPLFFSLMLIALSIAIFLFVRYRTYRLRTKNRTLQEMVSQRTHEIEEQNEELRIQAESLTIANQQLEEQKELIETQNIELSHHHNRLEELVAERTQELEKAKLKAEESDQLKTAFLANMSHEIRTPMNAIVGFSSLLYDSDLTDDERGNLVSMINSSSESLLHLIDDILDLSMIESNQLKIKFENTALNSLIDNIHSAVVLINRNPDINIQLHNELGFLNLQINTDVFRLKQILLNLMNNAIKFTDKGFVELGVKRSNDLVSFYVRDTGRGMSSDELEVIFERFRKIEDDKNRLYRGAGLGLSISRRLSELLGGRLRVESNIDAGSTFYFELPWAFIAEGETLEMPPMPTDMFDNWKGKNVLVVEDEHSNYLYLEKALKAKQISCHWAKDGHQALEMLHLHQSFDLVLMDINMPNLNGIDSFKEIKRLYPNQAVVAQTAFARYEDEWRIRSLGFDDFIGKPIKLQYLYNVIDRFLKD